MGISSNWAAKVGAMIALLVLGVTAQAATTLKIATLSPEGTGWMIELRQAAKAIRERTNDQVKLKIYPGGVMGDDKAVPVSYTHLRAHETPEHRGFPDMRE